MEDKLKNNSPMKVLHLPTDVGGNAWGLSQGERLLGLESDVLVARTSWIKYPADISLNLQETKSEIDKIHRLVFAFFKVRGKYDVYHFNFGSSLIHAMNRSLNLIDLPFYPRTAKLFATYNGCDARQKDKVIRQRIIAPCHNTNCSEGACNDGSLDQKRRAAIDKMGRYVKHIWCLNPDLLDFFPEGKATFLPYSVLDKNVYSKFSYPAGRLRIAHAPTNRIIKGTEIFLSALEKLKISHGDCFELILVENVPHEQALAYYLEADVVVDQLLIGWYGGLAVEVMLMGKPVICRIAEEYLKYIPKNMARDLNEVVINADQFSVYEKLVWCIENRQYLAKLAEMSYVYARQWHSPSYVASITKEAYESM